MEHGQRSNMTSRAIQTSGTSKKLPKILEYPQFFEFDSVIPHLKGHLVYVVRHYGLEGISVLVARDQAKDAVAVLCGDWKGNSLDLMPEKPTRLSEAAINFVKEDLHIFLRTMKLIRLSQAQFYLAIDDDNQLTLVDLQSAWNKLAGPGMVRDIFGKVYKTQEVLKVETMDDRAIEYIQKGTGTYVGDLMLKPSRFLTFTPSASKTNQPSIVPLYSEIKR